MDSKKLKKQREVAAKLSRPRPLELPSGKWRCQVMVAGKRIDVIEDDPAVAHAKALAVKAGLLEQRKPVSEMTVGEAIDRYIETKDAVLSPSTIAGYKRIRKNVMQDIMSVRLSELSQECVQRSVNRMVKEGRSPKYVRNAHGLLSAAIREYAPTLVLRTAMPQKERYEAAVPSNEDIGRIIDAVQDDAIELPVMLAIWLGLRMSEILGLCWSDIDGDVLHIRRAKVDEGTKTTKTFSSQRDLPIPAYIGNLFSKTENRGEYIVSFSRRALYSRFQVVCKRAGVQHYRFHDLRHINASVMLALGVPDKYAMERMGHATNNMLKTVYQHTMRSQREEIAKTVNGYFEQFLHTDLHTETHNC